MAKEQQGSLAAKLGGRLAAVNAEVSGQPLNLGRQRLPGGIRNGIAKAQSFSWKIQDKDDGKIPKGEIYFSGAAVVVSPLEHNGQKVVGQQTYFIIPLCDVPAKGLRKATSFRDNFDKFRSLMEALGVQPCRENEKTDPTGAKTDAYWKAAMASICNTQRPGGPVYISFSTRDWTPPKPPGWKQGDPVPETMTLEDWHGKADFNATGAGAVNLINNGAAAPHPTDNPPAVGADGLPNNPPPSANVTQQQIHSMSPDEAPTYESVEEEVAQLLANIEADEHADTSRLLQLAHDNGWTVEQTDAATWEEVGNMALNAADAVQDSAVVVGSTVKYAKRDKNGVKLRASNGNEFPPQEYTVTSINEADNTCTLKSTKDNKDLMDVRTKKLVSVKIEYLE